MKRKEKRNVTREEIYRAMEEEEQDVRFEWDWKEYTRRINLNDFNDLRTDMALHLRECWLLDILNFTLGDSGKIIEFRRENGCYIYMSYEATTEMNLEICDALVRDGISLRHEYEYYRYRY